MSEKKQGKKPAAAPAVVAKKVKPIDRMTKVKRDANGKKIMKVARGTARAARREGLQQDWKNAKASAKMKPPAATASAEAAAA